MDRPKHESAKHIWVEMPTSLDVELFASSPLRKYAPDVSRVATIDLSEDPERTVTAILHDARARWQDAASAVKYTGTDPAKATEALTERVRKTILRMEGTLHGTVGKHTTDPVLRQLKTLCVNILPKGVKLSSLDSRDAVAALFTRHFPREEATKRFTKALRAAKMLAEAVAPDIKI